MGRVPTTRMDWQTWLLLVLAGIWSAGLIIAAFTVKTKGTIVTNSGLGQKSTSVVIQGTSLVQQNGLKVLFPLGAPIVAVGLVTITLWRRGRKGTPGVGPAAWTLAGLLLGVALLGVLTVGPFILPVGILVIWACVRIQVRAHTTPGSFSVAPQSEPPK